MGDDRPGAERPPPAGPGRLAWIVAAMRDPSFHDPAPAAVEVRETHMSVVVLAGKHAYKLKKPVSLPFADLATLERRRLMCDEEVRLNRRLAASVYIGVRSIVVDDGRPRLAAADARGALEYAVQMRRLDESRTLEAGLARGEDMSGAIVDVAQRIAAFHLSLPPAAPPEDAVAAVARSLEETFDTLAALAPAQLMQPVGRARAFSQRSLDVRAGELRERAGSGLVRECHGDLRAEHVFLTDPIDVIDCVEFDPDLRRIDVGADLSFLVMDLERLGAGALARRLVQVYREAGADPGPDALIAFHAAQRAWIRSKVALIRARELAAGGEDGRRQERDAEHLAALGARLAWRARLPLILVVCGPPASGKTTLAETIAHASALPCLHSDVVRKLLAGVAPTERAPAWAYTDEFGRRTYSDLGRQAAMVAAEKGGVVVDATFGRRADREAFLATSARASLAPAFLECSAPPAVIERRAAAREGEAGPISDAGPEIAARLRERREPLVEVPADRFGVADTTSPLEHQLGIAEALVDGLR